jgi:hypothetical protein
MDVVPLGDGKCVVSTAAKETVGLPNYSKIEVGPVEAACVCDDTPEARKEAWDRLNAECIRTMAELRLVALESVKAFAKLGGYGNIVES